MVGVILLVAFFFLHALVIITERGKKCIVEKKFWVSLVFMAFLLTIAIYGNSCSHKANKTVTPVHSEG